VSFLVVVIFGCFGCVTTIVCPSSPQLFTILTALSIPICGAIPDCSHDKMTEAHVILPDIDMILPASEGDHNIWEKQL
jgi:hypothetical protein